MLSFTEAFRQKMNPLSASHTSKCFESNSKACGKHPEE